MKDQNPSIGPHDIGGETAGPIDIIDHGMSHWEKHANALRMTVSGLKLGTLDEMRRACENLGDRYNQIGYFEKQTEALAIVMAEKSIIPDEELQKEIIYLSNYEREVSLEIARQALEEAFTPRIKSMLSKKVQKEMEDG